MKHILSGRTSRYATTLVVASVSVVASAQEKLSIYEVTSPMMSATSAMTMGKYLGTEGAVDRMGIFNIDNRNKIELVPQRRLTVAEKEDEDYGERATMAVDLKGFMAIKSWPRENALSQVEKAIRAAGLQLPGKPMVAESQLSIHNNAGETVGTRSLETIVSYQFSLDGVPLVGPGFKTRFAFAPSGELSQGYAFGWNVRRGKTVDVISANEAMKFAQATYGVSNTKLDAKLVYFAPSAEFRPKYLYPHYEVSGVMQVGEEKVQLRKMFVPAMRGGLTADIDVQSSGDTVFAKPTISGGRAPYRMQWSSSSTDLIHSGMDKESIQYRVNPRKGAESFQETLRLIVTDADGVQVVAKVTPTILTFNGIPAVNLMANTAPKAPAKAPKQPGRYDAGIEYIDWTANANNCRNEIINRGLPLQFFWAENAAWEQDFKKESAGGDDSNWMDDVDITFYTGHADGNGFVFKSSVDDTFLHFNDAAWGNKEAEWLVIAACGPLQPTEGGRDLSRWLPAFQGLHILMGYGNISYDSSHEGSKFMNRILRNSSPMRIRDAWISTASEEQGSDVLMGLMGLVRTDMAWNWDDYFWGKGPVGPDIPASQRWGYWYYVVPC